MKRYLEFDMARTIVLLLMPFAHIYEVFHFMSLSSAESMQGIAIFEYIASLGAAVFMICMGINFTLSKKNSPKNFLMRGLKILAAALILNIFRYILPGVIETIAVGKASIIMFEALYSSVSSDILYFAALFMFFLSLMLWLKAKPLVIVAVTAAMSVADYLIPNPSLPQNQILEGALGNFIYIGRYSCFAFLQWAIFPAVGYLFGCLLKKAEESKSVEKLWRKAALAGVIVLAAAMVVCSLLGLKLADITGNQADSYNMELLGAIIIMSVAFAALYLVHLLAGKIKAGLITRFCTNFSKSITVYYVLQWLLITWAAAVLYIMGIGHSLPGLSSFAIAISFVLITSVSVALALLFSHFKTRSFSHSVLRN